MHTLQVTFGYKTIQCFLCNILYIYPSCIDFKVSKITRNKRRFQYIQTCVVSMCVCVWLRVCVVVGGSLTDPPLKPHSYCGRRSCEVLCAVEFSTQHKTGRGSRGTKRRAEEGHRMTSSLQHSPQSGALMVRP